MGIVYQCSICGKKFYGEEAKGAWEECQKQGKKDPLFERGDKCKYDKGPGVFKVVVIMIEKGTHRNRYIIKQKNGIQDRHYPVGEEEIYAI